MRAAAVAGLSVLAGLASGGCEPRAAAQDHAAPRVMVSISSRTLTLERRGERETFPVSLGAASAEGAKQQRGDRRTPRGAYFIARLRPRHPRYHRFALLSYPGPDDAARGVRARLIDEPIARSIEDAFGARRAPPQDTPLGGQIGIHGLGTWSIGEELVGRADLTDGCIAMRDADIDRVWPHLRRGTDVRIVE